MDDITENLFVMWLLTGLSILIMMLRLALRWRRLHTFELGDYLTMAAILAALVRTSSENVAIVYGTNQDAIKKHHPLTAQDIYHREIGSKLTIVNRVFYTVYIWLQKSVVMCVIQQLLGGMGYNAIIRICWAIIGSTFIAATIVCLTECHPFVLYWQVVPPPGTCAAGALQLLIFSILEIATDLMLIAIPMRQLIKLQLPWIARIRLIVLFSVGLSIIAVTLLRLLLNTLKLHRSGASHDIANVEVLFAAIVANAPPIYGLLRKKLGSSARSKSSNALQDGSSRSRVELNTIGSKTGVPRIKSKGYTDITSYARSEEDFRIQRTGREDPFSRPRQ